MIKEPIAMEEIHKIREKLYEEEKKLNTKDLINKIHKEAEEVKKKYNFKFRIPLAIR